MNKYNVGDIISCRVSGIESYGIFVNVDDNYTGLIHISEVSSSFVRNVSDYVFLDEDIYAKVIKIDDEAKQLSLSIKDLDYSGTGKERDMDEYTRGFEPLRDNLSKWMDEKLREYNKN